MAADAVNGCAFTLSVSQQAAIRRAAGEDALFMKTHRIATPIGPLHVEEQGAGDTVFCWPSLYCDARTLDPFVEGLARTHRVLVVDGPGHGNSEVRVARFTLEQCADAAMAVLDALAPGPVTWFGVAWGGHVGVAAARRHPPRVRRLFLVNAPLNAWNGPRQFLMTRLAYGLMWIFGHKGFMADVICGGMIGKTNPQRTAHLAVLQAAMRRCQRRPFLTAVRSAMLNRPDLVPVLGEVTVPTVVIVGDEDPLLPVDVARAQAQAIPGAVFHVIAHSSHQSPLEATEAVLAIVLAPAPAAP